MDYNYFNVLGFSIDEIQHEDEATIKELVSEAHVKQYNLTIGMYANVPRSDGLTQAQWQKVLNDAKNTLLDPQKRQEHIATLTQELEEQEQPGLTFPDGEEARDITSLAALLEQHATYAAEALYDGTLEQHLRTTNLRSTDQNLFADAAQTIVDQFPKDRHTGLMAMLAILQGQVRMQNGKRANSPKRLARLIDQNWEQAKTLLYNGFFAIWLEHVYQQQLADTAKEITTRYVDQQDIGLETFVQELDARIGNPIPDISHPEIHFNGVDAGSEKTIRSEIKNTGRGFLHGEVQLKNEIPGLQISDTNIHGEGVVTIHLNGNFLTSDQAQRTSLGVNSNGQNLEVPIYINHGIQPFLRWVAISGVLMMAITLSTRLIISLFLDVAWAGTLIFGIGVYAHWLLIVEKSFNWQRLLKRIGKFNWGPIKWGVTRCIAYIKSCFDWANRGHFAFVILIGVALVIASALIVDAILATVAFLFTALASLGASVFTGLDKLFYLGFNIHIVIGWAFWGLVIGLTIQGYRAMKIYDQKWMKICVAAAPVLLLCVVVTTRYVSASEFLQIDKTTPIVAQSPSELETETIKSTEPEPVATQQAPPESEETSTTSREPRATPRGAETTTPPSTQPSEPRRAIPKRETTTPPSTQPSEPRRAIPKRETTTPPAQALKPAAPAVPSEPVATQQAATESNGTPIPSVAPVPATSQQAPTPLPPTTPSEPPAGTLKQETPVIPTPEPKPITPTVPSDMILIPAGEFQMGSNDNTDEKPIHTVHIDAFYIDKYEVTNAQYKAFIDANPQWQKNQIPSEYHNGNYLKHWNRNDYPNGKADHPVTYVSWYAAMAYAKWVDKRLPTEAEWEKAARGGKPNLKYPWGNTISNQQANYGNHVGGTTVVGNYAANAYGLSDMAGNVLEWCLDAYYGDFYSASPRRNPLAGVNTIENADLIISDFTNVTTARVARGGAWYNTEVQNITVAYRNRVSPTLTNIALGFRCVKAVIR